MFIAGLMIPCHSFVLEVLRKYRLQLHELSPSGIVHLAKFIWAVESFGGKADVEVFAKYFSLHYQPYKILNEEKRLCASNCGVYSFKPRSGLKVKLQHTSNNRWSTQWHANWFYVTVPDVEVEGRTVWPLASRLINNNPVAEPDFNVDDNSLNNRAFLMAYRYCNNRDLVEEFCAVGICPLAEDFSVGEMEKLILPAGTEVPVPKLDADLRGMTATAFVPWVERCAGKYLSSYSSSEEKNIRAKGSKVRFNRILMRAKISYPPRPIFKPEEEASDTAAQGRGRGRGGARKRGPAADLPLPRRTRQKLTEETESSRRGGAPRARRRVSRDVAPVQPVVERRRSGLGDTRRDDAEVNALAGVPGSSRMAGTDVAMAGEENQYDPLDLDLSPLAKDDEAEAETRRLETGASLVGVPPDGQEIVRGNCTFARNFFFVSSLFL